MAIPFRQNITKPKHRSLKPHLQKTILPLCLLCSLLYLHLSSFFIFTRTSSGGASTTTSTPWEPIPNTTAIFDDTVGMIIPNPVLLPPGKTLTKTRIQNEPTSPSLQAGQFPVGDDEDDVELLKLAARLDPNAKPFKKLAFMFLTTSPLPFAPLWEMFFAGAPRNSYNVYVHADPAGNYTPPFSGVFSGRVIPSKPTRRHTPTLVAAARRLLANALLHDGSNSMFALLSPSCVPLHSFNFTRGVLLKSGRSFMELMGNDEPGAYDRWAARGEDAMLPEVDFEDFRFGSQFWVLNRKHARIIVSDTRLWRKFRQPCLENVYVCYPEEHYFPTLLSMVDPQGCVPCTLTHVDWSVTNKEGHPRTFNASEVGRDLILGLRKMMPKYGEDNLKPAEPNSFVQKGRSVFGEQESRPFKLGRPHPFLFARKFSPESVDRLLSIANDVILRD